MNGLKTETGNSEPIRQKGLINTEDRISEILYGLIMALTFTCTIGITKSDKTTVHDMLFGALSCNTAWGLIDAVMYLLMAQTDAARGQSILNFIRTNKSNKSRQYITDAIPPVIAGVLKTDEVELIRERLSQLPATRGSGSRKLNDFKTAVGIFFLVLFSTFPVAIPFLFIDDLQTALRTSNIVAILMMFFCGWGLGKYAARNSFFTGIVMSLFGAFLVFVAIALGG